MGWAPVEFPKRIELPGIPGAVTLYQQYRTDEEWNTVVSLVLTNETDAVLIGLGFEIKVRDQFGEEVAELQVTVVRPTRLKPGDTGQLRVQIELDLRMIKWVRLDLKPVTIGK